MILVENPQSQRGNKPHEKKPLYENWKYIMFTYGARKLLQREKQRYKEKNREKKAMY